MATIIPAPKAAYSLEEFAHSYGITRQHLTNLIKQGKGPRVMRLGRRVVISVDAAAEWKQQRESAA